MEMIAPADGRPEFAWTSSRDGSFTEGRVRSDWRDLVATDRQVTFMALEGPGMVTVTASLVDTRRIVFHNRRTRLPRITKFAAVLGSK